MDSSGVSPTQRLMELQTCSHWAKLKGPSPWVGGPPVPGEGGADVLRRSGRSKALTEDRQRCGGMVGARVLVQGGWSLETTTLMLSVAVTQREVDAARPPVARRPAVGTPEHFQPQEFLVSVSQSISDSLCHRWTEKFRGSFLFNQLL